MYPSPILAFNSNICTETGKHIKLETGGGTLYIDTFFLVMAMSVMGCVPVTLWMVVMHPCKISRLSWITCPDQNKNRRTHSENHNAGASHVAIHLCDGGDRAVFFPEAEVTQMCLQEFH